MKYAIIKTGGKQYKVNEGGIYEFERLSEKANQTLLLSEVLLVADNGDIRVGTPFVENAVVKLTVLADTKGKKIRVSKFKAKARYRRVMGHRQALSKAKVDEINIG